MVITKREDVTKQGFCKENSVLREVSYYYLFNFWGVGGGKGWRLFEFKWEWEGGGGALI